MGSSGEAQNIAHQQKHLDLKAMRDFRDRFAIPVSDSDLMKVPFYRPPDDSPEARYLFERTRSLGSVPQRRRSSTALVVPKLDAFESQLKGSGEREISTTMAFTRILTTMVKDKSIGKRVVPIVADESRTFGMEGMFRQLGIYSHVGQLYKPQDAAQLMYYREDVAGQILQEGINEAGRDVFVDRRRDELFDERRPDDPRFRVLFDVRFSAHRGSRVGRRRYAQPRLPHRRHLRTHDAQRRGPPARGRPQPTLRFLHS